MRRRDLFLLVGVLALALLLRCMSLGYDLPYIENPDEAVYLSMAQEMFRSGKLAPHILNIPSVLFDVTALAHIPYYLVGKLTGAFADRSDIVPPVILTMGVSKASLASSVLWARGVIVLFGVGTVAVMFFWGREATGRASAGLLAALMTAVSPIHVGLSRSVTPDTPAAFFLTLAAWFATRVLTRGEARDYLLSGAAIGLAASSKYNAGLVLVLLPVAHWLRVGAVTLRSKLVWRALLACLVSFVATSPITVIAFPRFLRMLAFEGHHYATAHPGMEGGAFRWYLAELGRTAPILYGLAAVEMAYGLSRRSRQTLLLATFPVPYFAFISAFAVRNDRTYLPLTFFCFVLAASLIVRVAGQLAGGKRPLWQPALAAMVLVGAFVQPLVTSFSEARQRRPSATRAAARQWITANVPAGAKIALEAYSPFLEPSRFDVHGFTKLTEHEPDWYRENGFQYLVFSQGIYGRFFANPPQYEAEVRRYRGFFDRLVPLRLFPDAADEVRVYTMTATSAPIP